jgi:tripartite-type tricarboxylate transporter receptor subunit TctC
MKFDWLREIKMKICGRWLQLRVGAFALSFIFLVLSAQIAASQTTRTIRIVVPFPAGGSADILARLLGEQIGKANGPTVEIENRPGGGDSIA